MILELPYGTFELPDSDATAFGSAQGEGFWDRDLKPHLDAIPAGSRAVDVGAHVGLYTGYLASRGVRVDAIEAHPEYWALLGKNTKPWRDLIRIHRCFVYSYTCYMIEQREHPTFASNTWLPMPVDLVPPPEHVQAYPLDVLLVGDQTPIALLKVDAQGADLHVLLGAAGIIERDHPVILIEYEGQLTARHGHTADSYRQWIADHQYREHSINGWNALLTWEGR